MGGQVVHMPGPGLDMTEGTVRWRIIKGVVGRFLGGMRDRFGNQIVVVAVLAVDGAGAGHAIGNSCLYLGGNRSFIHAAGFGGQADAIVGVGVTAGAFALVYGVEASKVAADMAALAVSEDKG